MSIGRSEEARERQSQARARTRLRQRIQRERWRSGRSDLIVSPEELNALSVTDEVGKRLPAGTTTRAAPSRAREVMKPKRASAALDAETTLIPPVIRERVFEAIHGGARTWNGLVKQTQLSEDHLGLALADLLNMQRIRNETSGEERLYEVVSR